MKIYNEITMKFNELTGEWDTLSEDSFEERGPVSLARRRRRKRRRGGFLKKLKKRLRVPKKAKRRIRKAVTPSRKRRRKIGRGLVKGIVRGAKASRKIRKFGRKLKRKVSPSRKLRKMGRKIRKRVRPSRKIRKRVRPSRKLRKMGRKIKKRISPSRKIRKRLGLKSKKRVVRKKVRSRRRPTSRRKPTRRKGFGLKPGRGKIRRGGRKAVRRRVGKRGGRTAARKGRGGSLAARLGLKIKRSAALKARRRRPKPTRKIVKRRAKPVRARVRALRFLKMKRKRIPRKKAPVRKMRRNKGRPNIKKILKRLKRKPRPSVRGRRLSFPVRRMKPPRIPKWRPRGAPSNAIFLSRRIDGYGGRKDIRTDVMKWTEGYFQGDSTLEGNLIYTASFSVDKLVHNNIPVPDGTTIQKEITKTNEEYYFNVAKNHPSDGSSTKEFSVTFAHLAGSGSDVKGDSSNVNTLVGETEQLYKQWANILLLPEEADIIDNGTDGFKISATAGASGELGAGIRDDYVWILVGRRARMRDKINKKAWTLRLQGPKGDDCTVLKSLWLTDDSADEPYTPTPAGPRYNIVSGTAGGVLPAHKASARCYGWFYPEMGAMVFSGAELGGTEGIPGPAGTEDLNCTFLAHHTMANAANSENAVSTSCFTPNLNVGTAPNNALRFINCMRGVGTGATLRMRNELDRTQIQYFCRVKNNQMNHSNNPTFTSGSNKNTIRNKDMRGNPQVYITSVGLWNRKGQLLAIAKLSKPALKNFVTEATIKIQLEF